MSDLAQVVRDHLAADEIEYDEVEPGVFSFSLPGEKKLQTAVRLDVGDARPRCPRVRVPQARREPRAGLPVAARANLKMYAVAFAVDRLGDIYLDARLPLVVRHARRAGPAARLGADLRRRVVQRDPRARLRLLHPQGVGVAHAAGRADRRTSRRSAAGWSRARSPTRPDVLRRRRAVLRHRTQACAGPPRRPPGRAHRRRTPSWAAPRRGTSSPITMVSGGTRYVVMPRLLALMCRSA